MTAQDAQAGFILSAVILSIRFALDLETNNALNLTPVQFEAYPFRIP